MPLGHGAKKGDGKAPWIAPTAVCRDLSIHIPQPGWSTPPLVA